MTQLQKAFLACMSVLALSVFSSATWGQSTAGPVYVSGGPFIYNVTSGGGLVKVYDATLNTGTPGTTAFKYTGPYYSSLAIGPDNVDLDISLKNASHPFLLYACDDNTNTIIRFAPGGAVNSDTGNPPFDLVYNGGVESSLTPVCGRFSSTGDFYITNKTASVTGFGVYKIAGLANLKLGLGGGQTPVGVTLSGLPTASFAGITQKNVGDLLLVDTTDSKVFRSPYVTPFVTTPFSTATPFITSGLSSPVGIARVSNGDVFVANQGSSNVAHFDRAGNLATTCPSLTFPGGATNTRLFFLAASETDTIYAVASTTVVLPGAPPIDEFTEDLDFFPEVDEGQVWSWHTGQTAEQGVCKLQPVVSSPTLLFGVAVAPIPTASISHVLNATVANPTPTTFNFNSSAFQITAGGGCSATVTAVPVDIASVNAAIASAKNFGLPDGATPLTNLGEGGYEVAYVATWPNPITPACTSVLGGTFANAIFGLYDSTLASNPRIVRCDSTVSADTGNEPLIGGSTTCLALTTVGSYPLGGIIPADGGVVGTGRTNSAFYLVNANFSSGTTQPTAIFCGFFPPLKNTTDPTQAANFDDDDIILVSFRLAKAGGNCKTGPFDNTAKALLSIAQLTPNFNPIFPLKTFPQNAIFQPLGFGLYAILLPVHANHLALGEYSLSVLFLTDDTSQQTIVFNVVPDKD